MTWLLAALLLLQTADPRVTVADVEKATGLKGVQLVAAGSATGAGGGLNFATADRKMILMVNFGPAALYMRAKAQKEYHGMAMPLFHADVAGVGHEAFDSPPGPFQYVLYVRKGNAAASFTAYVTGANKATLTMEQIEAIARVAASRM
ncbi:MAG TPA: hypothetical protein VFB07_06200 [Vicinamibacterales bacterium]|nr:hypothetical protein [Vicinamibacterales bacterium]